MCDDPTSVGGKLGAACQQTGLAYVSFGSCVLHRVPSLLLLVVIYAANGLCTVSIPFVKAHAVILRRKHAIIMNAISEHMQPVHYVTGCGCGLEPACSLS